MTFMLLFMARFLINVFGPGVDMKLISVSQCIVVGVGVFNLAICTAVLGSECPKTYAARFSEDKIGPAHDVFSLVKKVDTLADLFKNSLTDSDGNLPVNYQLLLGQCATLKKDLADNTISMALPKGEFEKRVIDRKLALSKLAGLCLGGLEFALTEEKRSIANLPVTKDVNKAGVSPPFNEMELASDCESDIKQIDADTAQVVVLSKLNNEAQLKLVRDIDPDAPIGNFTNEQLKVISSEGEGLSDVASASPYFAYLEVGVSLMPKYNEQGENEGFSESNLFAVLKLDNRWDLAGTWLSKESWWYLSEITGESAFYQGIDVSFYSAPTGSCPPAESEAAPDPADNQPATKPKPKESCPGGKPIDGLKFSDVSNTVNASLYLHLLWNISGDFEIGPSVRYGILNRDKKGKDGDSVASYRNYGLEARIVDFTHSKDVAYKNGIPKFSFNYAEGYNEDFAGSGVETKRKTARFNYRIFDNQPVFMGLLVDGGEGPDTIAVTLSYGLKASSIFGFFSMGK